LGKILFQKLQGKKTGIKDRAICPPQKSKLYSEIFQSKRRRIMGGSMKFRVGQKVLYQIDKRSETAEVIEVCKGRLKLQLVNKIGESIRKYVKLHRVLRVCGVKQGGAR